MKSFIVLVPAVVFVNTTKNHVLSYIALIIKYDGYLKGIFKTESATTEKMGHCNVYCNQDICSSHNWT
jgi:hypothetical protein